MNKKAFFALLIASVLVLASCGEDEGPLTYEEFWAMSGEEQLEYKESFESVEDFYAWYNAAEQEYIEANPGIDAGDGEIDLNVNGKPK